MNYLYKNKIALVVGHTGFKGSWLTVWLESLGAKVVGLALEPPSTPSHFEVAEIGNSIEDHRLDIRNGNDLKELVLKTQPDFVFHLAAQALVKRSYDDPVLTFQTNSIGTLNLLEALRILEKKCTAIIITSDKCYKNVEWVWGYRESDSLGGKDPYSASKGAAEMVIHSHVKSFFPIAYTIQFSCASAFADRASPSRAASSPNISPTPNIASITSFPSSFNREIFTVPS